MIPLSRPHIGKEEIAAVRDVLKSGWLAHGPKVKEFEKMFADYVGVKHAISVNSCTSALDLSIKALGIKGDVLLPSFTFVASANAVVTAGATPVFVDIEDDTCNIDPQKIEEKIGEKTKAIMPVHFAGHPCEMKQIMEIAEKHSLQVIEDSAECVGGIYGGKKTGSFGIGCFSFFPTKNITTGEGGMITTDDDGLAEKLRAIKAHGIPTTTHDREKSDRPWARAAEYAGHNYRLCDINAAIGLVQLKKLDRLNAKRIRIAKYLNKNLSDNERLQIPTVRKGCVHVFQMYTIKLDASVNRADFIRKLNEKGVQASVHFDPPVHLQPFYTRLGWKKGDLQVTESVAERIVTLPIFPSMKREDVGVIMESVNSILK